MKPQYLLPHDPLPEIDMDQDLVHFHVHTKYSAKDGLCDPDELCKRAAELGYKAIAVTEHGVMYSVMEMAETAAKYGLKFIPGCEIYETEDRTIHSRAEMQEKGYDVYHFVLLAANEEGYRDLIRIVSDAGTVGKFDGCERTDFDFIEKNGLGKNIIATSACLGGRIPQMILKGQYEEAKQLALRLNDIFLQFYLEIQDNGIPEQDYVNAQLIRMSEETGIPLLLTSDIHYVYKEDGDIHDTLICIGFGKRKDDPNRMRYAGDFPYYLRSPREIYTWAQDNNIPLQALYNTKLLADFCDVKIPTGLNLMPKIETPEGFDEDTFLEYLCYESLQRYIIEQAEAGTPINPKEYILRLNYELEVIKSKKFSSYFLVLWDFVQFLKRENIFQGPGRGSAAGCLIAFLLGITKLDPIRYGLQFERFLNPERKSMPDIDTDIPDIHRPRCIEYLKQKYGEENVAQIMTFGRIGVKSGIRDLVRVLGLDPEIADEISKMLPNKMPDQSELEFAKLMEIAENPDKAYEKYGDKALEIVEVSRRFKEYMEEYPEIAKTLPRIEGCIRNIGIHAGGIIISRDKISNYAPVEKGSDTAVLNVAAFDMVELEKIGLLKMDFLGLRTLTVVSHTLDLIYETTGERIDLYKIGRNDPKVFRLIREGHTHGLFQIAGGPITRFAQRVKPAKFEDLIDILALFRPGPLDAEVEPGITMAERYIQNGDLDPDEYMQHVHPDLRPILESTRGVMVYQEQIMSIVQKLAGYTLGAADSFRRVIGKKKIKEVAALRWQFLYGRNAAEKIREAIEKAQTEEERAALEEQLYLVEKSPVDADGALARGYDEEFCNQIFDAMAKFAG